jgi:lipopolysaccharide/colanic/teichoic acid biosynthesis glycosyltransferase
MKVMNADGGAETNGAVWASSNDPRVTRVGTLIRKLHIDEIPQMINIIRGDIALVGPRPERPTFVSSLENDLPYYFLRHTITPGFTGWAQIMFRYARTTLDAKEKYEYDLYYIYNRSLFIDIGILLKTIQIIFTH